MSYLKQKSEFNLLAAEKLLQHNLYASSVHCSYYACFQLMKFTLKNIYNIDYEKQSEEISSSKLNSHGYVIGIIKKKIKLNLTDTSEFRYFDRIITDLKMFREESDYHNIQIDSDKGRLALKKANELILLITKKLKK